MAYVEWLRVASELGLEPREPHAPFAPFAPAASFRRIKRSAGGRAAAGVGAPYAWLFGERDGVEVFVVVDAAVPGGATFVGARIQPEVGAGLLASTPGPYAPYGGVRAADPVLDAALRIGAREAASAEKLLAHADKAALAAAAALGVGLLVTDSVVCIHGPGVLGGAVLDARLGAAARAARALGDARAELGPSKEQRALAAAWAPAAEAVGLVFDPRAQDARGTLRGCAFRVALESELTSACATLAVTFPTVLGWGLGIRREIRDPLETLFAQAAPPIGDPAFDAIVSVRSLDPTPRTRFGVDHALRAALADVALRAQELAIDDAGLWASFASPLAGPGEMAWLLGAAQLVAFHLAGLPRAAPAAPYR